MVTMVACYDNNTLLLPPPDRIYLPRRRTKSVIYPFPPKLLYICRYYGRIIRASKYYYYYYTHQYIYVPIYVSIPSNATDHALDG